MYSYKGAIETMEMPPVALIYDGSFLENKIEGYLTLGVEGRESVELDVATEAIKIGAVVSEQKMKSRTLSVRFGLLCESVEEMQTKFSRLKSELYREDDVEISFFDDPGKFYYGRLLSMAQPEITDGIFAEGSFEIFCSNPLKYSKEKESGNTITVDSPVITTPTKIEVRLSSSSSIQIKNQTKSTVIKITGAAIYAGNRVVFDFDQGKVFVNGIDRTAILDLESDFENFTIERGDVLTCSNGTMTVFAREVYL